MELQSIASAPLLSRFHIIVFPWLPYLLVFHAQT
jgi:hypothetical protein